jgi:multidrug efflux system outer membrane protein
MADYFPQVNLVGVLGLGSIELRRLFDRRSFLEQHAASFSLPLFNAGRIEENVNITKARHQQALISYE